MPDETIDFYIDNLHERLDVEVKNWLGGLQSKDAKAKLAKEIIALANHGGGYVFIGFEDKGDGHPEIQPEPGELEAFSQDNIDSIVKRYVTPPCQCETSLHKRNGSEITHPVITVPGEHRTPVWAKRGSPDNKKLQQGTLYIRRPGGSSEPPKTQDDWEKLLDRLVRARGTELLDAFRSVLDTSQEIAAEKPNLDDWDKKSYEEWRKKVADLPKGDGRKHERGYWTVSFSIKPFPKISLNEFWRVINQETPVFSGWPPFTDQGPLTAKPKGNVIEAWVDSSRSSDASVQNGTRSDFWRLSEDGKGFLLRAMQDYNVFLPEEQMDADLHFNSAIAIYRMVEVLKFVEALALRFSDENAEFNLRLCYYDIKDRCILSAAPDRHNQRIGKACEQQNLESRQSGTVAEIGANLQEIIFALLEPICEQFGFAKLEKSQLDKVVSKALLKR